MSCSICDRIATEGWTGLPTGTFHCHDSTTSGIVGCHVNWTGKSRLHTVCCHRTFSGDSAERKYHHPKGHPERCATEDEMRERGAVCRGGVWGSPGPDAGTIEKWRAGSDSATPRGEIGTQEARP